MHLDVTISMPMNVVVSPGPVNQPSDTGEKNRLGSEVMVIFLQEVE